MLAKIQALIAKVEAVVHALLDNVKAQIDGLNTPQKIAGAVVAVGLALDTISHGKIGIFSFLFDILVKVFGEVKEASAMTVAIAVIVLLVIKEFKSTGK